MKKSIIEKLEERKNKLNKQIRDAKKKEAEKNALAYKVKCELIGDAFIRELKENENIKSIIKEVVDKHVKKEKQRNMINLESL